MNVRALGAGILLVVIALIGLYFYKNYAASTPAAQTQQEQSGGSNPGNSFRDFTVPQGKQ